MSLAGRCIRGKRQQSPNVDAPTLMANQAAM